MNKEDGNVLLSLYKREAELEKMLESIRYAIIGFGGTPKGETVKDVVKTTSNHLKRRKKKGKKESSLNGEYDKNLTWDGKTIYAVKKLNGGFVTDIVDELVRVDNTLNKDATRPRITNAASKLYRQGKLTVEEVGNKYKYFLKG